MGYHIYHDKLSMEMPQSGFGIELFEDHFEPSAFKLFEKYFQKVQTRDLVDTMILCNSSEILRKEKIRLSDFNGIFYKADHGLIEKYIKHKGYDHLVREEEPLGDDRVFVSFYNYKTVNGYYSNNVFSHSFKDCIYTFSQTYEDGMNYSDLDAFKHACELEYNEYRFLDKNQFNATKELFRKNMIDEYEYGKSFLMYC